MIKKNIKIMAIIFTSSVFLSSCYSYTSIIGDGPQKGVEITQWNHYVLFGLAPVGVSDSKEMAGGDANYRVHTRQTFINGLVAGLTFGIYTPSTTTVTK